MEITLKIEKATLLKRKGHTDTVYLFLDKTTSLESFGEYLPFFGSAVLKVEAPQGRGEATLKAMCIEEFDKIEA